MKKSILTIATIASAFFISTGAKAQGGAKSIPVSFRISTEDSRKGGLTPDAAELAKKTQTELYREATSVTWESLGNDGAVSSFTLNEVRHRAVYDKRGKWRWTEKSYAGSALSQEFRDRIAMAFGDVSVKWVDEILMPNSAPNYFILIKNDTRTRRIRIVEDKTEVLEDFPNQ